MILMMVTILMMMYCHCRIAALESKRGLGGKQQESQAKRKKNGGERMGGGSEQSVQSSTQGLMGHAANVSHQDRTGARGPSLLYPGDKKEQPSRSSNSVVKEEGSAVYEEYGDQVREVLPWMENIGDKTIEGALHDLLLTNPRFANNAEQIDEKLKEKTILLDNPDVKRRRDTVLSVMDGLIGQRKMSRKELCEKKCIRVKEMGLTYVVDCLWNGGSNVHFST